MEPQTAHGPLKSDGSSLARRHLLIYYRAKLLTVRRSSRADVSLETHCNKMNCHCFLAELYKLPHQSHNMGPPPLAINQWERRRRREMSLHFLKLRSASGWQVLLFPGLTRGDRKKSEWCCRGQTSEFTPSPHRFIQIIWIELRPVRLCWC